MAPYETIASGKFSQLVALHTNPKSYKARAKTYIVVPSNGILSAGEWVRSELDR